MFVATPRLGSLYSTLLLCAYFADGAPMLGRMKEKWSKKQVSSQDTSSVARNPPNHDSYRSSPSRSEQLYHSHNSGVVSPSASMKRPGVVPKSSSSASSLRSSPRHSSYGKAESVQGSESEHDFDDFHSDALDSTKTKVSHETPSSSPKHNAWTPTGLSSGNHASNEAQKRPVQASSSFLEQLARFEAIQEDAIDGSSLGRRIAQNEQRNRIKYGNRPPLPSW